MWKTSARPCGPGPTAVPACRSSRGSCKGAHMSASQPSDIRTPRMEALARLPVFFGLQGRRAVVAGAGAAAAWKIELLSAAGAHVDVYAAQPSDEVLAAAQAADVTLFRRHIDDRDFAGAMLAIGAFDDEAVAAAFAARARAAGVPVNVVDRPALSDFSFGTIVNRSPLVVGISTDGAAPVFAQAVRAKIEAMIPQGFAAWADAARRWRAAVKSSGLSFGGRRRFWQLFTTHAVANPGRAPEAQDFDALLGQARHEGASVDHGSVTLVGAGPGDPELLTLRAVRGEEDAGRQIRLRTLMPAGRDQPADDHARAPGQARGAAQGRRPDDLRPRRRGACGLPRRGPHRRGGARHH